MIFHRFCIRKSFQNTSTNPPKIITKIDQKINPFFNAFLKDVELQNGSKMPPESSQKPSKKASKKSNEKMSKK